MNSITGKYTLLDSFHLSDQTLGSHPETKSQCAIKRTATEETTLYGEGLLTLSSSTLFSAMFKNKLHVFLARFTIALETHTLHSVINNITGKY